MTRNTFGNLFTLTTFGESHGEAVGGVIDGMPAGIDIDLDFIQQELNRRRPGQSSITTSRQEADKVELLSGVFEGKSTGCPIGFIVRNTNQHSQDYENLIADGLTVHEGESTPRLTEQRLYLRESDKQLSGTIKYKIKEKGEAAYGEEQSITFQMVGPENPAEWQPYFSRNHTWIVYAYLAWAKMRIVDVHFKDWETTQPSEHSLYNW